MTTNPFAGLEIRVEPPDTGPVIAAQQAAATAFWAAEWATRTAIAACWSAFDAGLDTRAARQAAGAAGSALEAAITALAALQVAGNTLDDALKAYIEYVGPDGKPSSNPNPYRSWRKHAYSALGIESSIALTDPRDIDRLSRAFFDVAETIRAGMGHQANRADINRAAMQAIRALTVDRVIEPAAEAQS